MRSKLCASARRTLRLVAWRYFSRTIASTLSEMSTAVTRVARSEEHTSELQSPCNLVCRLLLEKKKQHSFCEYLDLRVPIPHKAQPDRPLHSPSCPSPPPVALNPLRIRDGVPIHLLLASLLALE